MTESPMADASARPRRILCVSPRYAPSFGTFEHAFPLTGRVRAFMPPQGLLVIAASLPAGWEVRFVDENLREVTRDELHWAEAVFVSGMHVQRREIHDLAHRAHAAGKVAVLGGPSVSASPELYPEFDYLHVGELGDATEALYARLAASCARPVTQVVLRTEERRPLAAFPVPAYRLLDLSRYFLASIQFSSGCPYRCEFCDIPALYGRVPRLKTPEQVLSELDALHDGGHRGAVYFVDDNFIGNQVAAKALLPHLVAWQRDHGFPFQLACEATVNLARWPDVLRLMRDAGFTTVFCGIESPEPETLKAIAKTQNNAVPILDAVRILNSFGLEVVAGIILGLDGEGAEGAERLLAFVEASRIPMLTINLLQALPRSPLWDRLQREGRLLPEDEERESNVAFERPHAEVVAEWKRCLAEVYRPENLYARFTHQLAATYARRLPRPRPAKPSLEDVKKGLGILGRLVWNVGIRGDYRATFWRFAAPLLASGDVERVLQVGLAAHHLITFAKEAVEGRQNASFYSHKERPRVVVSAPEPRRVRLRVLGADTPAPRMPAW